MVESLIAATKPKRCKMPRYLHVDSAFAGNMCYTWKLMRHATKKKSSSRDLDLYFYCETFAQSNLEGQK